MDTALFYYFKKIKLKKSMKNTILKMVLGFLCLISSLVYAQKTQDFSVSGACGMCKKRIENTAKKAGATQADYSVELQKLTISWDENITSSSEILKQIADIGHDNEQFRASEEAYHTLPDCCHYKENLHHQRDEHSHNIHKTTNIQGVDLVKTKAPTTISKKQAGLVIDINKKELLKAACCNLSESFETNATVDVAFNNAVSGTKQLKMLGLDQKYTSFTKEQFPDIRGLATAYGLGFIPGRWIEGIQLTKGGSTVVSGHESITGQINTELLKYKNKQETTFNLFVDNNLRMETNITQVSKIAEKWGQSILIHSNGTFAKMDYNKDNFIDQPTGNQINVAYLLDFNDLENSGWGAHFGINFLKDQRYAGQMDFDKNKSQSEQKSYGVGIQTGRIQMWNKVGYIFKNKPYRSIGIMNQYTHHHQNSFFGYRDYSGSEHSYYSNLVYEDIINNTNHKYKAGISFLYDQYKERYLSQPYQRTEYIPSIYGEYTLTGNKITLVMGSKLDFHNLAGLQFIPRINLKYDISQNTIFRISAGKGYRTANIFAENQHYFASNRQIEIIQNNGNIYGLKPEIAWNYGTSFQQEFKIWGKKSSLVADFFHTRFQSQVIADIDHNTQKILFYNLKGKSYANSFQIQWDSHPMKNIELRLAYKYYDVNTQYIDGFKKIPFIAKHRGFINIGYTSQKGKKGGFWNFDTTLNIIGKQRIPNTQNNPTEYQMPNYSQTFSTLNAQISKNFNNNLRIYLGAENITSNTQKNPIIDAKNPFGSYFDAGMIYKPIMPISAYLGFDMSF